MTPLVIFSYFCRFNPRAREGRDLADDQLHALNTRVSIHAPARGATWPTPPMIPISVFQSTRPRGARLISGETHTSVARFNPRAREGRDPE